MAHLEFPEKFMVYGAGQLATLTYTYCHVCGLEDRINCFVISSQGGNASTWCKKPVKLLDEVIGDATEGGIPIFLAMQEDSNVHVAKDLEKRGLQCCGQIDAAVREEMYAAIFDFYSQYPLEDKVFLESSGGRAHCDSQKYIERAMKRREDGEKVEMVWGENRCLEAGGCNAFHRTFSTTCTRRAWS